MKLKLICVGILLLSILIGTYQYRKYTTRQYIDNNRIKLLERISQQTEWTSLESPTLRVVALPPPQRVKTPKEEASNVNIFTVGWLKLIDGIESIKSKITEIDFNKHIKATQQNLSSFSKAKHELLIKFTDKPNKFYYNSK